MQPIRLTHARPCRQQECADHTRLYPDQVGIFRRLLLRPTLDLRFVASTAATSIAPYPSTQQRCRAQSALSETAHPLQGLIRKVLDRSKKLGGEA